MAGPEAIVEPLQVLIASTSNGIRVVAEDRLDVVVDGNAEVERQRDALTIQSTRGRLEVRVPEGSDVVIGTTSARVDVLGKIGELAVTTESGRVTVEAAKSVDARSRNGRVQLGDIDGDCRARSKTGRITVASCASADVATATGAINLDSVDGNVRAHCVNGRIDIVMSTAHDVSAESVTGRIDISLPRGANVLRLTEFTGEHVDRDQFDCVIDARSSTGRVSVSER